MEILRHPFGKARTLAEELRRALELARVSDIATRTKHVFPANMPMSELGTIEFEVDHPFALVTERGRVTKCVDQLTLAAPEARDSGTIGALARPIGVREIVTGSTPALAALYSLDDAEAPLWVINGRDIDHELWFWDFEDTLVRLSLFGVLLVLEDAISLTATRTDETLETCLGALREDDRKRAHGLARRKEETEAPSDDDVFAATSFGDKRRIVTEAPAVFGFETGDAEVEMAMDSAVGVRNAIAHGDSLVSAMTRLRDWQRFVSSWLSVLRRLDPELDVSFDQPR